MNVWQGRYFDGRSAGAKTVEVRCEQGSLRLDGPEVAVSYSAGQVRSTAPIGAMPWRFDLPDGGALEVNNAALLARQLGHRHDLAGRLERSWKLAVLAVPLLVGTVFAAYQWGLPWLADRGAEIVPVAAEQKLASETLAMLDRYGLADSKLPRARQEALRQRFAALAKGGNPDYQYRLEFRNAEDIGPNAFALPGGTVVMTDQLVELASSDDELLAVLAHEIGHVELRHGVRGLLRSSGLAVAVSVVLGDATSVGTTMAALPVMLADLRYSRDFEREADDFALRRLPEQSVSPCAFSTVMHRIEAEMKRRDREDDREHEGSGKNRPDRPRRESSGDSQESGAKPESDQSDIPAWFSTHPDTHERTRRFADYCPQDK
ncbi:M48 family metallopeptidase [Chitinimonas lacunae]|uniref:M48 family metallopeptidase n=1 Tax=Chitinimonas lacunae TaxID=1963018 RepID=A0ABV8MT17_9NEIS